MADLIDRDAVLHDISTECSNAHEAKYYDAQVALTRAKRIIRDAPAVNCWIPVEDALPEENVRCIVYTEGGGYGISRRMGRNLEKWNCFGLQVTHWMPLPEPPEKE